MHGHFERMSKDELYDTVIKQQERLRKLSAKLDTSERQNRRLRAGIVDKYGFVSITQRIHQVEKQNDKLIYWIYRLYCDLAIYTNTEKPDFSMVRNTVINTPVIPDELVKVDL